MRVNLTAEKVDSIGPAPEGKRLDVFDAAVPGLVLRVTDKGVKTFAVRYRHKGRSVRYTIGKTPPVKLKEARATAHQILAAARQGENPAASKRSETVAAVDALVEEFISKGMRANKPAYVKEVTRLLRKEVAAVWKSRDIASVETQTVARLLDRIESVNTRRQTFNALRTFFRWCRGLKYIEASPIDDDFPAPEGAKKRERVLTRDELTAIWSAVNAADTAYDSIVKLLILTGQRRDEVAESKWEAFDLKRKLWTLTDTKNSLTHRVPLSPAALDALKGIKRGASPYLFPGEGHKLPTFSGFSNAKDSLDKRSGVSDWHVHDLRRTMATRMAEAGVLPHVIERILNHKGGEIKGVAAVYNRASYLKEMRSALDGWAEHVGKLGTVVAPVAAPALVTEPIGRIQFRARKGGGGVGLTGFEPKKRDPYDDAVE